MLLADIIITLCLCTGVVMFMRANIVGTIIVLSLILWIPICIVIYVIVSSVV